MRKKMITDHPNNVKHRLFTRDEWKMRYRKWRVLQRELIEAERKMIDILDQLPPLQRADAIDRIINPPFMIYWGEIPECE